MASGRALTDIVQVTLLVAGGCIITWIALDKVGEGAGVIAGFQALTTRFPEKFDMILSPDNPHYKDLPGLAVLLGGMWMMNVSYWGFNQYIIQRGLAAKSVNEAQKGIVLAAFLKLLMPAIIVVPGIAALVLVPGLEHTDQAYPSLMAMLPTGIKGLVFARAGRGHRRVHWIQDQFDRDHLYDGFVPRCPPGSRTTPRGEGRAHRRHGGDSHRHRHHQAVPEQFQQGFQYIQDFTGFVTPGICVIFLLGLFWERTTSTAAMTAALVTVLMSAAFRIFLPEYPFMNRVGWCFVAGMVIAVVISLATPRSEAALRVDIKNVDFRTGTGFNLAAAVVVRDARLALLHLVVVRGAMRTRAICR